MPHLQHPRGFHSHDLFAQGVGCLVKVCIQTFLSQNGTVSTFVAVFALPLVLGFKCLYLEPECFCCDRLKVWEPKKFLPDSHPSVLCIHVPRIGLKPCLSPGTIQKSVKELCCIPVSFQTVWFHQYSSFPIYRPWIVLSLVNEIGVFLCFFGFICFLKFNATAWSRFLRGSASWSICWPKQISDNAL